MLADRNGSKIFYTDAGRGPPVLLAHCFAGNHAFMQPIADDLARDFRVVSVDARGHGQSDDAVGADYSMPALGDDLAWIAGHLGLENAILVGHSMGGNLVLEAAAKRAERVRAVVILDASTVPPAGLMDGFRPVLDGLQSPAYEQVIRGFYGQIGGFDREPARKRWIQDEVARTPQHVLVGAMESVLVHDSDALAAQVKVPILYVSSGPWYTDVERFRSLCPQLVTAQVVGSGHQLQLEVPEQVNPIIRRFISYYAN